MADKYWAAVDKHDEEEFFERLKLSLDRHGNSCDESNYLDVVKAALPDEVGRRLMGAQQVAYSDLHDAVPLIPFYDQQVVAVCPDCVSKSEEALQEANRLLEILLGSGLAIPVVLGPLAALPDSTAKLISNYPRISAPARGKLGSLYAYAANGGRSCNWCPKYCDCPALEKMRELLSPYAKKMNVDVEELMQLFEVGGDESVELLNGILSLEERAVGLILALLYMSYYKGVEFGNFARGVGGSAVYGGTYLDAAIPLLSDAGLIEDAGALRGDQELRERVARNLGVSFDPNITAEAYVEAVGPYAGRLGPAFDVGGRWIGETDGSGESWDAAVEIVADINDSVARIARTEARLKTVGRIATAPLVRPILRVALMAGLGPGAHAEKLAEAALTGVDAIGESLSKPVPIPKGFAELLEALLPIAPGSMAVHEMRKALKKA